MRDVTNTSHGSAGMTDYMESVLALVPGSMEGTYRDLDPSLLAQDELTLRTLLKPTEQMRMVRSRLWVIINERMNVPGAPRLSEEDLAKGIAPIQYVGKLLTIENFVAWAMIPVADYDTRMLALLDRGYDRIKEILEMPILVEKPRKDPEAEPEYILDAKAAALVMQAVKMTDMRVKGNYTERIEQKTLQINGTTKDAAALMAGGQPLTLDEIEKQIQELESKKSNKILGTVIDVETK